MNRIQREAINLGMATYYVGLARREMAKLALDAAPNDPQSAVPGVLAKIAAKLRRELSPTDFKLLMRMLRGDMEGGGNEDWETDDPPLERPELRGRDTVYRSAHAMDSAIDSSLRAMFGPDTMRIQSGAAMACKPLATGYAASTPKRRGVTLAMDDAADAAAFDSFEAMFVGTRKEH